MSNKHIFHMYNVLSDASCNLLLIIYKNKSARINMVWKIGVKKLMLNVNLFILKGLYLKKIYIM